MSAEPNPAIGWWQTFTIDHSKDDAVRRFQERYGCPPEHIIEDHRYRHPTLKVGPVPEHETDLTYELANGATPPTPAARHRHAGRRR